jgi:CRISPR/Cas system-associated exonuclease Cas4 (RecB family)
MKYHQQFAGAARPNKHYNRKKGGMEMFEVRPFPEFSWSLSRHKTLMDCSRKYAFDYYVSHNGWLRDSNILSKDAYRFKKMTNLELLFGSAVHEIIHAVITHYLNTGYVPVEEQLIRRLRDSLNSAFIDSKRRAELWKERPNHYLMLHEIYYGNELPIEKIDEIQKRLNVCMGHFLTSKTFQDIREKKEMHFVEAERFRFMYIDQVKIYVVMDFLYRDTLENKWIIVDWKTGKESFEDRHQLALYALYLQKVLKVSSIEDIEIRNEYLLTGTHKSYQLTQTDLEKVQELCGLSVREMQRYLVDIALNHPIHLHEFPKTESTRKCDRCNYKELCDMY